MGNRYLGLAVALAVGVAGGMLLEHMRIGDRLPKQRTEPNGSIVYGWPGASAMREDYSDRDNDGNPEQWSISAWYDSPHSISYTIFDDDDDGTADDYMCIFGSLDGPQLSHFSNARVEWMVALPTADNGFVYYSDLDGDALFDMRSKSKNDGPRILIDNCWVEVSEYTPAKEPSIIDTCVLEVDGEPTHYHFVNGKWQPIKGTTSTIP